MITYGNIYIISEDFEKSIDFYKTLFKKDVEAQQKTKQSLQYLVSTGLYYL